MTELRIISRAEAKAQGLKRYFTGKPCKNGHLCEKYVESGCVECVNDSTARRRADPVKRKKETTASAKRQQVRRKADPEWRDRKNAENRARMNARYKNDTEYREKAKEKSSKQQSSPEYKAEQARRRKEKRQSEIAVLQLVVAKPLGFVIMSRSEAASLGLDRYFTAKPCENGHIAERLTVSATCVICHAATCAKRRASEIEATPPWLTKEHHRQIEDFYAEAQRLTRETGEPWEVDHITPLRGANVCGLHVPWNLRVIPRADNRSKGNKLLDAA